MNVMIQTLKTEKQSTVKIFRVFDKFPLRFRIVYLFVEHIFVVYRHDTKDDLAKKWYFRVIIN